MQIRVIIPLLKKLLLAPPPFFFTRGSGPWLAQQRRVARRFCSGVLRIRHQSRALLRLSHSKDCGSRQCTSLVHTGAGFWREHVSQQAVSQSLCGALVFACLASCHRSVLFPQGAGEPSPAPCHVAMFPRECGNTVTRRQVPIRMRGRWRRFRSHLNPPPPPLSGKLSCRCTPQRAQVSAGVGQTPAWTRRVCIWMHLVNGTGPQPRLRDG